MKPYTVRTRFAPSPTGYMHIGGMRTALFNWLFAKSQKGEFILRIDDTDKGRNIQEAIDPILRAFRWLELFWDEGPEVGGAFGPYYQSERAHIYKEACDKLLDAGLAYYDFDSPEQIQADREDATKAGREYINIRRSLDLGERDIEDRVARGDRWAVRFLVPRDQTIELDDVIRGHVQWEAGLISDPVIMRANGMPLYNLATVVDDAHMKISHIIRAAEHLSNTPVQVMLYNALGHNLPVFAHIPYVAAPGSTSKISKRKIDQYRRSGSFGSLFELAEFAFSKIKDPPERSNELDPVSVEFYERLGFVPAGLLNSLARIGWSLDDSTEYMSLDFLKTHFSLERVVKAPAAFDPHKLMSYQSHWMSQVDINERLAKCIDWLNAAGLIEDPDTDEVRDFVHRLILILGDRLRIYSDILGYDYFFRDVIPDEKSFAKRVQKPEALALLRDFRSVLEESRDWSANALEEELKQFVASRNQSTGTLIHALRISITGTPVGPGLFDCLALIGRDRTLARIDAAVRKAEHNIA